MSFPASLTRDDMQVFDTLELLPLRQMLSATREAATGFGDQGLLERLSRPNRFRILRQGPGGQILACNGLALAEAQRVLQQVYGSSIAFARPTAHTLIDHATRTVLVPVMFLRIDAPRAYRQELLRMLKDRCAGLAEAGSGRNRIVIRAETRLSELLGVETQVLERTNGSADLLCRLLRYSPASDSTPAADGGTQRVSTQRGSSGDHEL
jgi:hypothetical protein